MNNEKTINSAISSKSLFSNQMPRKRPQEAVSLGEIKPSNHWSPSQLQPRSGEFILSIHKNNPPNI